MSIKHILNLVAAKVIILVILFGIANAFGEFTCQTIEGNIGSSVTRPGMDYLNIPHGNKWPNGKVKYFLNSSLTTQDIKEVNKAIAEYHRKTCIQFEPKAATDTSYVSIEAGDVPCGVAIPCRQKSYQYAMFGGSCRTMNTMLHELGHTLCLYHEHTRPDRNNYLSYHNCTTVDEANKYTNPIGLYDYQSMMHADCHNCYGGKPTEPDVPKCGMSGTPERGMSVLDADQLNNIYDCQGCFRHRWRNASQLTKSDRENLQTFGTQSQIGKPMPMYPCRTIYRGQVVVGHGNFVNGNTRCTITYLKQTHEIWKNVEVLTIPGGLTQNCYTYKLKDPSAATLAEAVPAAANNFNLNEKMYIAYYPKISSTIGRVWATNGFTNAAEFAEKSKVISESQYSVLTCAIDQQCVQKRASSSSLTAALNFFYDDTNEYTDVQFHETLQRPMINPDVSNDIFYVEQEPHIQEFLEDIYFENDGGFNSGERYEDQEEIEFSDGIIEYGVNTEIGDFSSQDASTNELIIDQYIGEDDGQIIDEGFTDNDGNSNEENSANLLHYENFEQVDDHEQHDENSNHCKESDYGSIDIGEHAIDEGELVEESYQEQQWDNVDDSYTDMFGHIRQS